MYTWYYLGLHKAKVNASIDRAWVSKIQWSISRYCKMKKKRKAIKMIR